MEQQRMKLSKWEKKSIFPYSYSRKSFLQFAYFTGFYFGNVYIYVNNFTNNIIKYNTTAPKAHFKMPKAMEAIIFCQRWLEVTYKQIPKKPIKGILLIAIWGQDDNRYLWNWSDNLYNSKHVLYWYN